MDDPAERFPLYPVVGVAVDYDELHRLMRLRADQIDRPRLVLDAAAGLSDGYASKLLQPNPSKRLGPSSMGPMLRVLGLRLLVLADDASVSRIQHDFPPRCAHAVRSFAT